jgi:DNA-binding MarR family transcriptional regulator
MQLTRDVEVAPDRAVDELGDAVVPLVRAYRHAGRRPEAGHAALSALELVHVLGEGERRLSELAELRGVGQSVVSRQVGELEARHLACRRPDPTDGRASLVRLTPAGRELLATIHAVRRQWLRDALARHPAADVHEAARLLTALADALNAHPPEFGIAESDPRTPREADPS